MLPHYWQVQYGGYAATIHQSLRRSHVANCGGLRAAAASKVALARNRSGARSPPGAHESERADEPGRKRERPDGHGVSAKLPCTSTEASSAPLVLFAAARARVASARRECSGVFSY
jgi:hypothetical protein